MKKTILVYSMCWVCLCALTPFVSAQNRLTATQDLRREFDLDPRRSKDTQYFEMVSRMQAHAPDGTPQGWDVYRLYLRCVPSKDAAKGDEYTCLRFTAAYDKQSEVAVPSLAGWSYFFSLTANAMDANGQLFGIDHSKFEGLSDENGKKIPVGNAYFIYNTFIDFHSMNVFSENSGAGPGVQDLRKIGDKVRHAAAFSQAPVNLGSQVAEGSTFTNGEVTLLFKGLSTVNDKVCAILEYDSGESSFNMVMKPAPTVSVTTKGSSHYWGDIYKDLESGWIQKAVLHELVVSETSIPGMNKMNGIAERSITIMNIKSVGF